jgi:phosphoglycerate dehydrogenase-like enzyme
VSFPFDYVDHATLLGDSDVVTVHVDGRPENRGMLNARLLGYLRPDAMLLNAARGMLVAAEDLAAWAREHPQAHLVLDVHEPEPPGPDYPLAGLPNVRLLPHLASRTGEALENMSWVVRDVVRVLQGEPPHDPAT